MAKTCNHIMLTSGDLYFVQISSFHDYLNPVTTKKTTRNSSIIVLIIDSLTNDYVGVEQEENGSISIVAITLWRYRISTYYFEVNFISVNIVNYGYL